MSAPYAEYSHKCVRKLEDFSNSNVVMFWKDSNTPSLKINTSSEVS